MRRPGWLAALLVLVASASLTLTATAAADTSAEQRQLVSTYSPELMLREQTDPGNCNTSEEQYSPPTTVNTVLGNPGVKLVHYVDGKDVVVKTAPTATDVAGLSDDYYLDLPGDPLHVHCRAGSYPADYARLRSESKAHALTYAHIATEPGYSGFVIQYFFFYYFNQFNDVHEGDWEGMQISFAADDAAQALRDGPSQIALFQHAGGERADWDSSKVQKNGTHPIVYPAAGSHATFYDSAIYIENGSHGSGVGCDNTSEPLTQADPAPIIVPTAAAPGSEFQWLGYLGHWGQREKGFNNGPQGPTTKRQWLQPFTWMDGIRQDSPKLPGGSLLGPAPTTAFCGAIEQVSRFINLESEDTLGAVLLVLAALLVLTVPPFLTRWRPVDLSSLRHRWAVGQLLRGAAELYARNWRVFLPIGLSALIVIGAFEGAQWLFERLHNGHDVTIHFEVFGLELRFSGSFDGLDHPIGATIVWGAAVAFLRLREEGKPATFAASYRAMYARLWRVVAGQLLAVVLVFLMIITVIGIPFAAYFYIAWLFIQQEILFENRSIREAMASSHEIVRGNWWRTVLVAGILLVLSVVTGPVLGFILIFLNWAPWAVNAVGSLVFALLMPYVAIGRTLLYLDLCTRTAEAEAAGLARRRRWRLRPRPATGTG